MPPRSLLRGFLALWMLTGLMLFIGAVFTLRNVTQPAGHPNPHIALIGAVEAVAALLFLIPRTMRIGAVGLIVTIGAALAVHTIVGEFRGDLIVYGAVVTFVAIHGALTGPQWREATRA
jgi:uncharacterized membrane protein YphA (DoxX/SURF4 family)